MVSTAAPLYSFLRNRSEAKTKTPILSENHLTLKYGSHLFFLKIFTFSIFWISLFSFLFDFDLI